jgi:hypothetical protein
MKLVWANFSIPVNGRISSELSFRCPKLVMQSDVEIPNGDMPLELTRASCDEEIIIKKRQNVDAHTLFGVEAYIDSVQVPGEDTTGTADPNAEGAMKKELKEVAHLLK